MTQPDGSKTAAGSLRNRRAWALRYRLFDHGAQASPFA